MYSQVSRRALVGALAPLLGLLLSVSAHATPISHTVTGASTFSSGFSASGTWTMVANGTNVNGTFSMSGSLGLAGTPVGTVAVDWGSPGWNDSIAIPPGGLSMSGQMSGGASGSVSGVDLLGLASVNLSFQWTPSTLTVQGGGFLAPTVPSDGATPGPGPWAAAGPMSGTFYLPGTLSVHVNGSSLPAVSLPFSGPLSSAALELDRVGGFPGTGSKVGVNPALSTSLAVPPTQVLSGPLCELTLLKGCALTISSMDVTITKAQLTNPALDIWATSNTAIVPEPGSGLLLGTAAAFLVEERVRRSARRSRCGDRGKAEPSA